MVHTRAGSVVVTESEGTYRHRHSMVMAIHRWSNEQTDAQTGGGFAESQSWRFRFMVR